MDIRSRLSRIRSLRPPAGGAAGQGEGRESAAAGGPAAAGLHRAFKADGWIPLNSPAGALTLRKIRVLRLPLPLPPILPPALSILAPGGGGLSPESLRFFDLETTGLSIGAGTIPFLAAAGVPERGGKGGYDRIRIVQYLLLDYPGEEEFLEALVKEFGPVPRGPERGACGGTGEIFPETPPVAVSYNGKTFDVPILRNRCLMQGLALPAFGHLDLLHSARRLWKGVLPNCSQAMVETEILSLSREGDLSGAFAPDSWFDFLHTGNPGRLLQIGDHNSRDILGLASILACLCRIAADPLGEGPRFSADPEQLALCWQRAAAGGWGEEEGRAGALLERAAALGRPRCCRKLAVEAEWRGGDFKGALALVERALGRQSEGEEMPAWLRLDLEGRRKRLLAKAAGGGKKAAPETPLTARAAKKKEKCAAFETRKGLEGCCPP